MNPLRRLVYLGYYFKQLDWAQLDRFMRFTADMHGVSRPRQWTLVILNSLKYNISLLEFYQFGFLHKTPGEKATWAGTGTMYEFQRKANPPAARGLLQDKRRFYLAYRQYFRHEMHTWEALAADPALRTALLTNNERLVFKSSDGNCGRQVAVVATVELDPDKMIEYMQRNGFDLVETFALQHPRLNELSPSAVNTVRIFTRLDEDDNCIILGCRLRISVNSPVDNLAAGNLAAPIDEAIGVVNGPGVYSDITKLSESVHPVTGIAIVGFQVPFWLETLAMVREASVLHPENRSIGWDIVITPEGPGLIEGNHDWCKLVWQIPVGTGLKPLLFESFIRAKAVAPKEDRQCD